jgi:hypothetical protein
MTDAISPEFRLSPEVDGGCGLPEWQIDSDHALMLHQPTRALFSIYPAPGTDPDNISAYDLRARLSHVCDGFPVPDNVAALGAQAINAFLFITDLPVIEVRDEDQPTRLAPPPFPDDDPIPF